MYTTWVFIKGVKTIYATTKNYYKPSHKLVLKHCQMIKDEYIQACYIMLLYNDDLKLAHY